MKKIISLFVLMIVLHVAAGAQDYTNVGNDFWLAFIDNCDIREGDEMYTLFAVSSSTGNVTVSNPSTGWDTTFSVNASFGGSIHIPMSQAYNYTSCTIFNKGIHVTSSCPISLYYSTRGYNKMDMVSVLPSSALGSSYMAQTYPSDRWGSEFVVVAAQDSVWVDILLSDSTSTGIAAGTTLHIYLPSAGCCYQVKSNGIGDLTGSRITARNCKHIAVFHGDACPYIPDYATGGSCDHTCEQAIPTRYWGTNFIVNPSVMQVGDKVLITSLEDSCTVAKNGLMVQNNLMSGQTYTYTVYAGNPADYITTDKPVAVSVFFSSTYNTTSRLGSPSMVSILPLGEWLHQSRFGCFHYFPAVGGGGYHANIITKQSDISYLRLDGIALSAADFSTLPADNSYAYANISLTEGLHQFTTTQGGGFSGYIYALSTLESFAYTLGGSLPDINPTVSFFVNGENVTNLADTIKMCPRDTVTLIAVMDSAHSPTLWALGNGDTLRGDTVLYCYPHGGLFRLSAIISSSAPTIWDTCVTTPYYLQRYCAVHIPTVSTESDTIRQHQLPWTHRNKIYHQTTIGDTICVLDSNGCTNFILYTLYVRPSAIPVTYCDTSVCEEDLPCTWHGHVFEHSGYFSNIFTGSNDDDSVVVYRLSTRICYGNDSLLYPFSIWVPNVFTPDKETNNRFCVYSKGLISIDVTILNREGLEICRFDGLRECWDGTHNGTPCKQDSYIYLIEYHAVASHQTLYKKVGTVTLIR